MGFVVWAMARRPDTTVGGKNPITVEQAVEIVRSITDKEIFRVAGELPGNCAVYNAPTNCWYVLCSGNVENALTSSRLICICRDTGDVLYDGSAGDEG